jgi:[methyl-Co(III) methanol-specific corrinoid protein]:coenzyme M methyltransferase|tara:strand:- start:234 stop:1244 length:1011 start_codon:yes stop_codon:yes gene_type:complete
MTKRKKVLSLLKGKHMDEKICSCPLATPTVEQMELEDAFWPEAQIEAEKMASLAGAAHKILDFDGIRIPFDLCVEGEAFGCKIKEGIIDRPPSILEPAFKDPKDFTVSKNLLEQGRIPNVLSACNLLSQQYSDVPIYGGIVGPITLAGHILRTEWILKSTIKYPNDLKEVIDSLVDFSIEYANTLLENGANVICILDPVASGDMLSARSFKKFLIPAYKQMHSQIKSPIILHICGSTTHFLKMLLQTGLESFSFEGPTVDVKGVKEVLNNNMVTVGNIPTSTLLFGSPKDVNEMSLKALADGVDILAPACGIPPRAPIENIREMSNAVKSFNKRKN